MMAEKMSQSDIDALIARMVAGGEATAGEAATVQADPGPAAPSPVEPPAEAEAVVIDLGPIAQAEVDAALLAAGKAYALPDPAGMDAPALMPESLGTGMTQANIDALVAAAAQPGPSVSPPATAEAEAGTVLMEVELTLTAELVRTRMRLNDLLSLQLGAVIELNRLASEPVDVTVNGVQLMKANVVTIGENYGIQVIESRLKAS